MEARPIVRDLAIANGRWHFENTAIFIDDIQRDFAREQSAVRPSYRSLGVTDTEFETAIAFDFPEIAEAQVELHGLHVTVNCVCGIRRLVHMNWTTMNTDECPCGRRWHIDAGISLVAGERTLRG